MFCGVKCVGQQGAWEWEYRGVLVGADRNGGGVSAVVMHQFEIERKKTYLNVLWSQVCRAAGCLGVGVQRGVGGCSRVACVCVKGQLEMKGMKGLPFFW